MGFSLRSFRTGNLAPVTITQFATAFSLNFVNTFMPFYIIRVSPYPQRETLLWVGAIVGLGMIFTALASPIWGSLTHRYSPKMLYMRGMFTHSLMFLLMAFTSSLPLLLVFRIIQGAFGGVSTTGIILVSSASRKEDAASNMGVYQSALTLGQLIGPPAGTFAAAFLGYRNGFLAGAAFLFASFFLTSLLVTDVPPLPKKTKTGGKGVIGRRIIVGWLLCLAVQIQLAFLPSVLPNVLAGFRMDEERALKFAGLVVMLYTTTAMLGQVVWTRLSKRFGVLPMITFLVVLSIVFQAGLALSHGLVDFTVIRMLQTAFAASVIPLIISLFLDNPSGGTVGFINASRFTGMSLGPILGTWVLAFSSLNSLYLLISALTVLPFVFFRYFFKDGEISETGKISR
jgi:MFS family permease